MKTLSQHIEEKLIVNKNYKDIDDIEELFGNIDFKRYNKYELGTSDDIFSIMVDYICDHNIRSFSNFDSYKKESQKDHVYLAVFNKSIKEIDIFQKTSNDTYKVFVIFKTRPLYIFKGVERSLTVMHVLRNVKSWNDIDNVEYYEISKETFDDVSELYNELIKK